jgi:dGTPase
MAAFSPDMAREVQALKHFLFERMYRHPRVTGPMGKAQKVVTELFGDLAADPRLLPPDWAAQCGAGGDSATRRVVRDYIAGMTDNYALAEYDRISSN